MPPSIPLQDITVALGANPPSRISSQPMSRFPLALRKLLYPSDEVALELFLVPEMFRERMRAWHFGHFFQLVLSLRRPRYGHTRPGKRSDHFGEDVLQERKCAVVAGAEDVRARARCRPSRTVKGPPLQEYSGYAASAAIVCARHFDLRHDHDDAGLLHTPRSRGHRPACSSRRTWHFSPFAWGFASAPGHCS